MPDTHQSTIYWDRMLLERRTWRTHRSWAATALRLGRAYEKALRQGPRNYSRIFLIERILDALSRAIEMGSRDIFPDIQMEMLFIRGRNSVRAALGRESVYY